MIPPLLLHPARWTGEKPSLKLPPCGTAADRPMIEVCRELSAYTLEKNTARDTCPLSLARIVWSYFLFIRRRSALLSLLDEDRDDRFLFCKHFVAGADRFSFVHAVMLAQ